MTIEKAENTVSRATIARLPAYLRLIRRYKEEGKQFVSSTTVAEELKRNPVQVRKDLAVVSSVEGKPRSGFLIDQLIADIESFLGVDNASEAVLVGAGGLGKTLLSYGGFENYSLRIIAAFDTNPELEGVEINGKPIYGMDRLEEILAGTGVQMAVITVPKACAQEVCNRLIAAGIRAVWNFAPVHLNVPSGVAVKNEDLAASFAILSGRLREILKKQA